MDGHIPRVSHLIAPMVLMDQSLLDQFPVMTVTSWLRICWHSLCFKRVFHCFVIFVREAIRSITNSICNPRFEHPVGPAMSNQNPLLSQKSRCYLIEGRTLKDLLWSRQTKIVFKLLYWKRSNSNCSGQGCQMLDRKYGKCLSNLWQIFGKKFMKMANCSAVLILR